MHGPEVTCLQTADFPAGSAATAEPNPDGGEEILRRVKIELNLVPPHEGKRTEIAQ